jgi:cell division protein FtsI (penicillin-binding protein 3)
MEPGSTFKTASIMVALEDGYITPDQEVDTKNGVYKMYGSFMRDHNWVHGGYGVIDITKVLMVSSNIGVSRVIDENYHHQPEKFVDGLYKLGIATPLNLDIPGAAKQPNIRRPTKDNWSRTALAWMSIGYETQVPPMNTLAFYNAIANNGVMVKPKFVKAIVKDGKVIEEIPTEVLNPAIASPKTLEQIQVILEKVVSEGLGKKAGSKQFRVSGKTGTAQVSQGKGGYKNGIKQYLVSFCGYFPSEDPKYSCIVAIQKSGLPASGGLMAGSVFSEIAERVYAKHLATDLKEAKDSTAILIPDVKKGITKDANFILQEIDATHVALDKELELDSKRVPNVIGMGAKDAVYLLENAGLKVQLSGMGKVKSQSIHAGNTLHKGKTIHLRLN